MFERYTEPARRAIFFARAEALVRRSDAIETRDLLLGLTREGYTSQDCYDELQAKDAELRSLLGAPPSNFSMPASRDIPLSNNGKKSLAYAAMEADRDRRRAIERDHLLRGILLVHDQTATQLHSFDFTLERMRAASALYRKDQPVQGRVPFTFPLRRSQRILFLTVLLLGLAVVLYLHFQN